MGVYNGNRRDNVLNGSNRNDFMNGKEGNDTLYGNGGDDNLHGGTGNDRLEGGDGNDNLYGEDGTDTLLGGAGTDLLNGGSGNDTLDGGIGNDQVYGNLGADQLTGGLGADNFVYTGNLESSLASDVDRIRDYDPLTDAIQLGGDTAWVDANTSLAGTQQWQYVGDTRLAGELANGNGQATLSYSGGVTTLTLYRYGSSDAYMTLEFDGQFQPGEIDLIATQLPTYPWHVVAW